MVEKKTTPDWVFYAAGAGAVCVTSAIAYRYLNAEKEDKLGNALKEHHLLPVRYSLKNRRLITKEYAMELTFFISSTARKQRKSQIEEFEEKRRALKNKEQYYYDQLIKQELDRSNSYKDKVQYEVIKKLDITFDEFTQVTNKLRYDPAY